MLLSRKSSSSYCYSIRTKAIQSRLRLKINEVLKGYLQVIDKILEKELKGEFQADLDIRLARQMIFGTMDEIVTIWVMNDHKYDLVALHKTVHGLLIEACG